MDYEVLAKADHLSVKVIEMVWFILNKPEAQAVIPLTDLLTRLSLKASTN